MAGVSRNEGQSGSMVNQGVFIYVNKLSTIEPYRLISSFLHPEDFHLVENS